MSTTPNNAPAPLHAQAHVIDILHALVALGMTAAAIFVKNPSSQSQAAQIINLTNQLVLPTVDALVTNASTPAEQPATPPTK